MVSWPQMLTVLVLRKSDQAKISANDICQRQRRLGCASLEAIECGGHMPCGLFDLISESLEIKPQVEVNRVAKFCKGPH